MKGNRLLIEAIKDSDALISKYKDILGELAVYGLKSVKSAHVDIDLYKNGSYRTGLKLDEMIVVFQLKIEKEIKYRETLKAKLIC